MCKFHRLKNLVRFFTEFFPLWTMKDDFCWYCLWFCLLCSFVLDYLQKEVKAKFNFAKLKESLKFLWSELKNLEKWSKKCTEEEGFLKSMQHALLVSIQGWLQTVVTSKHLPESSNFSQMWKHLTTGNILKDHVQIRVVLGWWKENKNKT